MNKFYQNKKIIKHITTNKQMEIALDSSMISKPRM